MGLDALITDAIALADSLTSDLQASVLHYPWTGKTSAGGATYGTAVSRAAIIERKQRWRRKSDGEDVLTRATITILRPIDANGATYRQEPIDPRDKFVLPDGMTGPIADIEGLVSKSTSAPYYAIVYLS